MNRHGETGRDIPALSRPVPGFSTLYYLVLNDLANEPRLRSKFHSESELERIRWPVNNSDGYAHISEYFSP